MSIDRHAPGTRRILRAALCLAAISATSLASLGCDIGFNPCSRLSKATAKMCNECIARSDRPNVVERGNVSVFRGCG